MSTAEEAAITCINAIIDAALEQAEATLLRLDTDRKTVRISGKFATRAVSPKVDQNSNVLTAVSNSSLAVVSPKQHLSMTRLEPEPEELAAVPERKTTKKKSKKERETSTAAGEAETEAVDVFRFPLKGKDNFLNKTDQVYSDVDEKRVLIVRQLDQGTRADEKELRKNVEYYKKFGSGKQCQQCRRIIVQERDKTEKAEKKPMTPPALSPSAVSPSSSSFSEQTEISQKKATIPTTESKSETKVDTSFSTSRVSSSVVTEPSGTDFSSSYASNIRSKPSCVSAKMNGQAVMFSPETSSTLLTTSGVLTSTNSVASTGSLAINFSTVVVDPKTGQQHPLNFVAKCIHGQPSRVFINGKAFGQIND
uniref:Uncharacterized protein n=1 Tax=Panagrolaimus sp. JU765 TaxID=591449 RepID=A0AC34Q9P7_9BILA